MRYTCALLAALLVLSFVPAPAHASAGVTWTKVVDEVDVLADPFTQEIVDLAVNPVDENVIYLATQYLFTGPIVTPPRGLLKSTDGGKTWSEVDGPMKGGQVLQVSLNPIDPSELYVCVGGSGIYRSGDGGRTWKAILYNVNGESYNTPQGFAYTLQFAVDKEDFHRLLAWTREHTLTGSKVFLWSTDGGDTWTKLDNPPAGYPGPIQISLAKYGNVAEKPSDLVFTWSGDGGKTWHETTAGELNPAIGQPGEPVYNVPTKFLFDPHGPRVYGVSESWPPGHTAYWVGTLDADGLHWEKHDSPAGLGVWGFTFDPRYDGVTYVEVSDRIMRSTPADARMGLYMSVDGGQKLLKVPGQPVKGYPEIMQAIRTENSTVLYVKLFPIIAFDWTRWHPEAGHSTIWRVEIPDSFIKKPETTITLRVGSREMGLSGGVTGGISLDAAPMISSGRCLLPVRPLAEALGGDVSYADGVITIVQGTNSVTLRVGDNTAVVNGKNVPIDENPDVKPQIVPPGVTMLPLRFVCEALGAKVTYDNGNISIIYPDPGE